MPAPKPLRAPEPLWRNLHRPTDKAVLLRAHYKIQALLCYASGRSTIPFIVMQTQRGKEAQEKAKAGGNSNAHFGQSPHNYNPALAADIAPVDEHGNVDWNNIALFKELMDDIKTCAKELNIAIVCGEDWKSLKDYPHVELADWRTIKGKLAE